MILPFIVDHIAQIRLERKARETFNQSDMTPALKWMAETGNGKSLFSADGSTLLGVMGCVPTVPGVCEVFVIASEDQARFPMTFARAVKKEVLELKRKYRRIQAVADNDSFHTRWLSWLGFVKEGVLRGYGFEGRDMAMWGMV